MPTLRESREEAGAVSSRTRADHAGRREDAGRYPRVAARWLLRYLEEDPAATIEKAGLAGSALLALTGAGYQEAMHSEFGRS